MNTLSGTPLNGPDVRFTSMSVIFVLLKSTNVTPLGRIVPAILPALREANDTELSLNRLSGKLVMSSSSQTNPFWIFEANDSRLLANADTSIILWLTADGLTSTILLLETFTPPSWPAMFDFGPMRCKAISGAKSKLERFIRKIYTYCVLLTW